MFIVTQKSSKNSENSSKQVRALHYSIGQRSQDLEPPFPENGLLYITKAS
jgi:CMP-N-acetylneuraminic acid synthetase